MAEDISVIECQRCGRGFLLVSTYIDWLARRGIRVVQPIVCPTCFKADGPLPKQGGEVKWFSPRKHYGFIIANQGAEIFFHQRQIMEDDCRKARQGRKVKFHVHDTAKGPEALNVELV